MLSPVIFNVSGLLYQRASKQESCLAPFLLAEKQNAKIP